MNNLKKVQGNLERVYDKQELISSIKDYLDIALIEMLQLKSETKHLDVVYYNNEDFWRASIQNQLYAGQIIKLEAFKILEWIPSSPGLFYTSHAKSQREAALESYKQWKKRESEKSFAQFFKPQIFPNIVELRPNEKMGMIKGGYGSLRVAPKFVNNELQHILCATSTGISHEGLPVTIKQFHYSKIIEEIKNGKTPVVNILGRLMILPNELSPINLRYHEEIPKFYLEIEELEIVKVISAEQSIVSVSITYSNKLDYFRSSSFSYSFCSFSPTKNNEDLREAVLWLQDYAVRYSEESDPIIVGDFDEEYNHFENVAFPIQDIAKGKIPMDKLHYFKELFHFKINELYMGDKIQVGNIENNHGQIVIGKGIKIVESREEKQVLSEKIDELIKLLRHEDIPDDSKQSLVTNFDKVKEEISDEENPDRARIFKWLTNTKNILTNVVLANHTREAILWIYQHLHFII